LSNEEDPTTLTAFVTGTAIPGTKAHEQFNIGKSISFDNMTIGRYDIKIKNGNNQVYTIEIKNPEQCDNLIASNNDDEICKVFLETDINDGLNTSISGDSLNIARSSSAETFKTIQTAADLMSDDEKNDPPFRGCEAFEIIDHLSTPITKLTYSPSSAQYLIKAAISGEKLNNLIKKNEDDDVTFTIINNLNQVDNIPFNNEINSKYWGQIAFYNKDGTKGDILNFRIDNIDTECRYVTLNQSSQKLNASQEFQLTPLTEEEKFTINKHYLPNFNDFPDVGAPSTNNLQLMDGRTVVKFQDRNESLSVLNINPPFGSCVGIVSSIGVKDLTNADNPEPTESEINPIERDKFQFAEYVMFGSLVDKISKTNTNSDEDLLIKLTIEQNHFAVDSAKIIDNVNPYVNLELFYNSEQYPEEKIDFHLKELSYNCHGIGFAR
jgi:hypothetical protein